MRNAPRRVAITRLAPLAPVAIAACALVFAACSVGGGGQPTPVVRPLAAGEMLGQVDRASSGTPDAGIRTLMSVACENGRLDVRTNVDAISAADDCTQAIPQSTLDELLGLPAVITYTGDHLVVENAAKGIKLDLPAKNAVVGAIHGSP